MIEQVVTLPRSVSGGRLKAAPPFPRPTRRCRRRPPSRTVPLHWIPLPFMKSITIILEKEAGSLQILNVRLWSPFHKLTYENCYKTKDMRNWLTFKWTVVVLELWKKRKTDDLPWLHQLFLICLQYVNSILCKTRGFVCKISSSICEEHVSEITFWV